MDALHQGTLNTRTVTVNFEKRLTLLCGSIDELEHRVATAEARAEVAEEAADEYATRLNEAEAQLDVVLPELASALQSQDELHQQVHELEKELRHCRIESANEVSSLAGMLERGQLEKARLRAQLSSSELERDGALADLSGAYADMQAMQAALLDSALYVRFLRAKLLELKLDSARSDWTGSACTSGRSERADAGTDPLNQAFSFEKTKEAIQQAVQEAAVLDKAECAKRIKQLRLRWHPDKNPVLQEFATEVTKIINKAVEDLKILD